MHSFKEYLVEAKFDGDNMERVLNAFQKRMPRMLGSKIYRYGGPNGTDGMGILYFFKDKAFRVRIKGSSIQGIDVWDEYHINKGPSYFIDIRKFSAENILASMSKLAKIIKNPEEGKIAVKESTDINLGTHQLDEMARRVDPKEFVKMGQDQFGPDEVRKLTWSQIQQIAHENDVLIPGYVKGQRVDKLHWSLIPGDRDDSNDAADGEALANDDTVVKIGGKEKGEPILYIKVTAQDPDTKRFISAADSKKAQQMYAKIQNALRGDPSEEELKDPDTLYGHLAQLVGFAADGKLRSLLIYGGPGTGKTFTIMQTIKEKNLVSGKDYVKMSGKASPIKIYETLFMYRDGGMVVFDDLDSMWRNEDATNILKAALDTSPVREISWDSNNTVNISRMTQQAQDNYMAQLDRQIAGEAEPLDDFSELDDEDSDDDEKPKKKAKTKVVKNLKFPATFEFKGRVVFISNLKKEEFDSAILSRSAKIDMSMSPSQILMRMRKILPKLGGEDVALSMKEELIEALLKMHGNGELDQVTMREFTKGLDILRSGAPNWKDLLQYA